MILKGCLYAHIKATFLTQLYLYGIRLQGKSKAKAMQVHGKLQYKSIEFAERRDNELMWFQNLFLGNIHLYCE